MSKRNRREHGRIISVETLTRGDALAADVAAGATSITVNDAGDFDEDGGWLYIGAQAVEYTACDDDTGVITLATALTAAGEQGDSVQVWSDLYDEVVDYQLALVELDGEYDNPDPVVAEVAEGVGDLPEGDRGRAGESCTLKRVTDDEWEVVGVGGRPRKSRSIRFEQDDAYALTSGDVAAGSAVLPLSHRPIAEALTCVLAGVPQRPTGWTIDYDAQTLTMPLSGWEQAGDVLWAHYAYRKDIDTVQQADWAFVAGARIWTATGGATLAAPATAQAGDIAIAVTSNRGQYPATGSAPGWTLVGELLNPGYPTTPNEGNKSFCWVKTITGSDSAVTITPTGGAADEATASCDIAIAVYRNQNGAAVVAASAGLAGYGLNRTCTAPSLTAQMGDLYVGAFSAWRGAREFLSLDPQSPLVDDYSPSDTRYGHLGFGSQVVSSAGATGTRTAYASDFNNHCPNGFALLLRRG